MKKRKSVSPARRPPLKELRSLEDARLSSFDLHLLGEGNHFDSYGKLGAHLCVSGKKSGVYFSVWAPNARAVSVLGDFNAWQPGAHPMSRHPSSGFWEVFVPGIGEGTLYKFAVETPEHHWLFKSDPYAFASEVRPRTASIVTDTRRFRWTDEAWMEARASRDPLSGPVSIYEVHLGSWMRSGSEGREFLTYRELAERLIPFVKERGYTHIELMPIAEHPLDESWGYQVISYFAPTSRFGTPEDFMAFVNDCHRNGLGVILDWVPAHFPKDAHGLADFDGRQIYAYSDWKKGEHLEWGTLVFDYGRPEVRNFLISNALFWLERYHIDGLRVDAVASMIYLDYSRQQGQWEPNVQGGNENLEAIDFLKKFNEVVHLRNPGVLTIAEESTAWGGVSRPTYTGGLGFSMKWNMGWMHDTLDYFSKEPVHRKFHQDMLTFSMLYAYTENFVLPVSHDEVVYGKQSLFKKMPGDDWQRLANARLFLAYMYAHPGKKLLFMTADFGQFEEWNCRHSMDWHLKDEPFARGWGLLVKDLNRQHRELPVFHELDFSPEGFQWLDFSDRDSSIISFIRWAGGRRQHAVAVFNMTPVPRMAYRVGVPASGRYREIFNSDAREYGGSGIGNAGRRDAQPKPWNHQPYSLLIDLPPSAAVFFLYENA